MRLIPSHPLSDLIYRTRVSQHQLHNDTPFTTQIMFFRTITTPTARLLRPSHSRLPRRTPFSLFPILPSTLTQPFSTTLLRKHGHTTPPKPGEELYVTFVDKSSKPHKFAVSAGENLLDIAQEHDLDMEGACGGSAACSTCHVIVADNAMYERIPEPEDDENDMLDLAFGLTETSRLGCQVKMSKEIDGLVVKLPSMTRNLQSSDFSKKA